MRVFWPPISCLPITFQGCYIYFNLSCNSAIHAFTPQSCKTLLTSWRQANGGDASFLDPLEGSVNSTAQIVFWS